jgi:hypothetical protein
LEVDILRLALRGASNPRSNSVTFRFGMLDVGSCCATIRQLLPFRRVLQEEVEPNHAGRRAVPSPDQAGVCIGHT